MAVRAYDPQEARELVLRELRMVGSYIYHRAEDIAPRDMSDVCEDGIRLEVRLSRDGLPVVTETCDRYVCNVRLHPDPDGTERHYPAPPVVRAQ